MELFNIKDCKHVGCLNNYKGTCTLDKLSIATFAVPQLIFKTAQCVWLDNKLINTKLTT